MYGNSMQSMMPQYLEATMANFRTNQTKIQEAFREGIGKTPIGKIHETNMAVMRALGEAILPSSKDSNEADDATGHSSNNDDEIDALRTQMAAMQKKLDELSK